MSKKLDRIVRYIIDNKVKRVYVFDGEYNKVAYKLEELFSGLDVEVFYIRPTRRNLEGFSFMDNSILIMMDYDLFRERKGNDFIYNNKYKGYITVVNEDIFSTTREDVYKIVRELKEEYVEECNRLKDLFAKDIKREECVTLPSGCCTLEDLLEGKIDYNRIVVPNVNKYKDFEQSINKIVTTALTTAEVFTKPFAVGYSVDYIDTNKIVCPNIDVNAIANEVNRRMEHRMFTHGCFDKIKKSINEQK